MESITFNLISQQHDQLNNDFPKGQKSAEVGNRAVKIVKMYFEEKYPGCTFNVPKDGCDLEVLPHNIKLEIKGTSSPDIAWNQLKVSGNPSYNQLLNDLPLFRVTNVYDREITIHILTYSEDFIMQREPRWAIKKRK